jgi:hypothetical protein
MVTSQLAKLYFSIMANLLGCDDPPKLPAGGGPWRTGINRGPNLPRVDDNELNSNPARNQMEHKHIVYTPRRRRHNSVHQNVSIFNCLTVAWRRVCPDIEAKR